MGRLICSIFKHKWRKVLLVLGGIKPISRDERVCERCGERQMKVDDFSKLVQTVIYKKLKVNRQYLKYVKGDWLDAYTRCVLIHNVEDE